METSNKENKRQPKNKKNRMATPILLTFLAIIILSNTPPAQFFLLPTYGYQNKDRSFTYSEEPGKGMDLEAGMIQFEGWKKQNPDNPNHILYRTFSIRPWQFWEWWQYVANAQRFRLPYL